MKIAFVTPEISFKDEIPIAGGLGILSGDIALTFRNYFDFEFHAFSILYKKGYVKQKFKDGKIIEEAETWEYEKILKKEETIKFKDIYIDVWKYEDKNLKVFLFSSDNEKNDEKIREVTNRLYVDETEEERILKRLILAYGTFYYIKKFDYDVIHLNEAFSTWVLIFLLKENIFKKIIFTIHTPLEVAFEKFNIKEVEKFIDLNDLKEFCSFEHFKPYLIAFKLSKFVNAVSKKHKEISKSQFPQIEEKLVHVTNGVLIERWMGKNIKKILDEYIPNWFNRIDEIEKEKENLPLKEVLNAHQKEKEELINFLKSYNIKIDSKKPIFTFARRFTQYKRPYLLFSEEKLSKLDAIFIFSGKAHPKDLLGKQFILQVISISKALDNVIYIPNYNVKIAKLLVKGSDFWIIVPKPPLEASATSFMKAGINGVPSIASRDGAMVEIINENYNGFFIGKNLFDIEANTDFQDQTELFEKINFACELFKDKLKYAEICKNTLFSFLPKVDSRRMVSEYINLYK